MFGDMTYGGGAWNPQPTPIEETEEPTDPTVEKLEKLFERRPVEERLNELLPSLNDGVPVTPFER